MADADPDEQTARLHTCDGLPERGVEIRRTDELEDDDSTGWVLNLYREATEEYLEEDHHLEVVGELIWSTTVEIRHCTFCGVVLVSGEIGAHISAPRHYDYSG